MLAVAVFVFCMPGQARASELGSYDIGSGSVACDSASGTYVISGSTADNYLTVSGGSTSSPIHITLGNANINLRHSDNDKSTERSAIQTDSGSQTKSTEIEFNRPTFRRWGEAYASAIISMRERLETYKGGFNDL